MRWIEQVSIKNLADCFELKETSIKGYLRFLKNRDGLASLDLTSGEMRQIKKVIAEELCDKEEE